MEEVPSVPSFSIVVTVTRPRLLQNSLRSALAQTFTDCEIIVSDNSPDGCRDVVESFGDSRLKYVRAPEYLPVVDSWEFAFSHATGVFQLLLCDDNALAPNLLEILSDAAVRNQQAKSISWLFGSYWDPDHVDPKRRGLYMMMNSSGQEVWEDSETLLRQGFESGTGSYSMKWRMPQLGFAALRRDLIDSIRQRLDGRLFQKNCVCPMTSVGLVALATTKRHLRLEVPLSIIGHPLDSASSHNIDPTTYRKMHQGTELSLVPIKIKHVFYSAIADTALKVQQALPELQRYPLNMGRYFLACYDSIDEMRRQGRDVTEEMAAFEAALAGAAPEIRNAFQDRSALDASLQRRAESADVPFANQQPVFRNIFEAGLFFGTRAAVQWGRPLQARRLAL